MKIAVCGSMTFYEKMIEVKERLEDMGHAVFLPHVEYKDFHKLREVDEEKWFRLKPKFIRDHFDKIKKSDAILVLNYEKNGIKNYVGGNVIFELGLAFDLKKKIFLLNPIPKGLPYTEELEVIKPIVINGDLSKIR